MIIGSCCYRLCKGLSIDIDHQLLRLVIGRILCWYSTNDGAIAAAVATYDVDGVAKGGGGGAGRFNAVPCIRLAITATEQLFIATFVRLDRWEAERQRMAYG